MQDPKRRQILHRLRSLDIDIDFRVADIVKTKRQLIPVSVIRLKVVVRLLSFFSEALPFAFSHVRIVVGLLDLLYNLKAQIPIHLVNVCTLLVHRGNYLGQFSLRPRLRFLLSSATNTTREAAKDKQAQQHDKRNLEALFLRGLTLMNRTRLSRLLRLNRSREVHARSAYRTTRRPIRQHCPAFHTISH